jgi:cold shock protein
MSVNGCVDWFSKQKGYGFICLLDSEERVFCHVSQIKADGYKSLYPGEYVSFNISKVENGKTEVTDVTGFSGGNLLCQNDKYRYKLVRLN